jgi:hypothetical protein
MIQNAKPKNNQKQKQKKLERNHAIYTIEGGGGRYFTPKNRSKSPFTGPGMGRVYNLHRNSIVNCAKAQPEGRGIGGRGRFFTTKNR